VRRIRESDSVSESALSLVVVAVCAIRLSAAVRAITTSERPYKKHRACDGPRVFLHPLSSVNQASFIIAKSRIHYTRHKREGRRKGVGRGEWAGCESGSGIWWWYFPGIKGGGKKKKGIRCYVAYTLFADWRGEEPLCSSSACPQCSCVWCVCTSRSAVKSTAAQRGELPEERQERRFTRSCVFPYFQRERSARNEHPFSPNRKSKSPRRNSRINIVLLTFYGFSNVAFSRAPFDVVNVFRSRISATSWQNANIQRFPLPSWLRLQH